MRKRAFDIVVISLAAVVWVPVVLVAAAAVLLLSGRPIFYRSHRWVGPARVIKMVKLRVMVPNAHRVKDCAASDRFLNTKPDSPLYTPVGRVLDRLGINEIPQFLHVMQGHMSIVGSRPLTDDVRDALLEAHRVIDDRWVTPAGLTGLPQLVGRTALSDHQRLQLEIAYSKAVLEGYRLRTDFMILFSTVLITFGLKKPLTFEGALEFGRTRRASVRELAVPAFPAVAEADVA